MTDESPLAAVSSVLRRAYVGVVTDGCRFVDAMYAVRAELAADSALLPALAAMGGRCRLSALLALVPAGGGVRWDRTAVVAVVVQSLLVGADTGERRYWAGQFADLLADLADADWIRAVDHVVESAAGELLSPSAMKRVVDHCPTEVSHSTLDGCCEAVASSALDRGDVGGAVWAVSRAASPFRLAAGIVEMRGETDRAVVVAFYRAIERAHRTDIRYPILACAHWLMLDEVNRARELLAAADQAVAERPESGFGWVAALAAELLGDPATATRLARAHCEARGADAVDAAGAIDRAEDAGDGRLPPVAGWILSRRMTDPRLRGRVLRRCLHPDRVLGGLESRLWFDLAVAESQCGRSASADAALARARASRDVSVYDPIGVDPAYAQFENLLARLAVTDAEPASPLRRRPRPGG